MPTGFAAEEATSIEVIAAWIAPKVVVSAVEGSPGWVVLGQYYLPKSCRARLDVIHLVSKSGLTSRVRLWDTTTNAPVVGSVETSSLAPVRSLGGAAQLTGGRSYQLQAECIGDADDGAFSVIEAATITD